MLALDRSKEPEYGPTKYGHWAYSRFQDQEFGTIEVYVWIAWEYSNFVG